eukprot:s221_g1.t1
MTEDVHATLRRSSRSRIAGSAILILCLGVCAKDSVFLEQQKARRLFTESSLLRPSALFCEAPHGPQELLRQPCRRLFQLHPVNQVFESCEEGSRGGAAESDFLLCWRRQ